MRTCHVRLTICSTQARSSPAVFLVSATTPRISPQAAAWDHFRPTAASGGLWQSRGTSATSIGERYVNSAAGLGALGLDPDADRSRGAGLAHLERIVELIE